MTKKLMAFVAVLLLSTSAFAEKSSVGVFKSLTDTYMVFSIPETLEWNPAVSTNISGIDFLENEIGVNVDDEAADAKAYFSEKFGVDTDALVAQGRAVFAVWELDQDVQCRVRVLSDAFVPKEGLPFRAGGFGLVSIDPAGIELGGEFVGTTLAAGGNLAKGFYSVTKMSGEKIKLAWKTKIPLMRPLSQTPLFYIDVETLDGSQSGTGAGIDTIRFNANGTFTPLFRNVVELHSTQL